MDSWGSLPLMQYRLTLKKPIRFAFAIQPFGVRNVNKLPSLLQRSRKVEERRKIEGQSSHSAVDTPASGDDVEDPSDLAGGRPNVRQSASGGMSGVGTPMRALSPPPAAGSGPGAVVVPSSLARSLRLRFGPKVLARIGRVRSFDGTTTPPWLGSGLTSPMRGSSPEVDEGSELIGGSWATAASAVKQAE